MCTCVFVQTDLSNCLTDIVFILKTNKIEIGGFKSPSSPPTSYKESIVLVASEDVARIGK